VIDSVCLNSEFLDAHKELFLGVSYAFLNGVFAIKMLNTDRSDADPTRPSLQTSGALQEHQIFAGERSRAMRAVQQVAARESCSVFRARSKAVRLWDLANA
jgi:hypothetical protein